MKMIQFQLFLTILLIQINTSKALNAALLVPAGNKIKLTNHSAISEAKASTMLMSNKQTGTINEIKKAIKIKTAITQFVEETTKEEAREEEVPKVMPGKTGRTGRLERLEFLERLKNLEKTGRTGRPGRTGKTQFVEEKEGEGELDPVCKECLDAIVLAKDVIQDVSTADDVIRDQLVDDMYFLCTAASLDHPDDLTTQDCEGLRSNFKSVAAQKFLSVVETYSAEYICGQYAATDNPLALNACSGLHPNTASFYQSLIKLTNPCEGLTGEEYEECVDFHCFPGDAVVTTSSGRKLMKDVSYGDKILSVAADGKSPIFDTVLFLLHRFENQTRTVTYVSLQTASGHLLEVSPNHLVYLNGCCSTSQLEAAYNAKVSDTLTVFVNGTAMQSPIVSVSLTEKTGFLNVGMRNGNRIVVNGVAATYFTEGHQGHLGSYLEYVYYFTGHILHMFPAEQVEYFVLPVQEFIETMYWPSPSSVYTTIHQQCPFWLAPVANALSKILLFRGIAVSISIIIVLSALILIPVQFSPSFKPKVDCYQKRRTSVKQEKQNKAY